MRHRLLALVLVAGCSPTTFAFTPANPKGVVSLPENCPVDVVTSVPPEKNYEDLGTLDFYNGTEPKTLEDFKKAVKKQVCDAGGDGVIAIANDKGQYTKGTVIHYLGEMAKPVKPITDVPATQTQDTEKPPGS